MIYETITFMITNKCNMSCPHCCLNCCPENNIVLENSLLRETIGRLALNPRIKTVAVSGGEPFLFPEKVEEMVKWIRNAGKKAAVYTNGFWCNEYDATYNTLKVLKTDGLSLLLTSVDSYHQMGVSIDNIKNLLGVCLELEIPTKVHVSTTHKNIHKDDEILKSLGTAKLNASVTTSAVYRAGRANERITESEIITNQSTEYFHCKYDGMCAVDWNGDVFWCCSIRNDNMIIGNIKKENINTILNRVMKKKLFLKLITDAPYVLEKIKERNMLNLEEKYADYCELCDKIFSNKELVLELEKEFESKYERK